MDFDALLQLMVQKKASDLFVTVGCSPSLKVDGVIQNISTVALTPSQTTDIVHSIMTPAQKDEFKRTSECQFAIQRHDMGRFRVSAFMQRSSAGMVLRRIESEIPTIDELGLPPILNDLAMKKRGLVIFVGATGTGKSTSLASIISHRNHNSTGHIITLEDPIEYLHNHAGCMVTQREIGIDTESYEIALKNTLRQAPDVILIGEIRSQETMQYAIAFAETGHLCLSTLHANNANQALDRIINFFPESAHNQLFMDLSLNLRGIVAQQLIPTLKGKKRIAAVEVLINTPLASDFIKKGDIHKLKELMKNSTELGMKTFDQALFELYISGDISYDDALHHADSSNEVRLTIKLSEGENKTGEVASDFDRGMHLIDTE